MAAEICQLVIAEFEEIVVTTAAAADAEFVPVSAAGSKLEAVDVGPGDEENSDLGAPAESSVVAGYRLA